MDIVKISQTYVQKMINNTPGMKILLLDDNTVWKNYYKKIYIIFPLSYIIFYIIKFI